jgi:glycosyltransferase involved in cell wall biosynthesis
VTDTTPWSGLAAEGCGWCVPWSGYPAALAAALALRPAERAAMGRRGRAWAEREFSWTRAARLLTEFYQHLLHGNR